MATSNPGRPRAETYSRAPPVLKRVSTIRNINEHDGKGWLRNSLRNPFIPITTIVLHSTAGSTLAGAIATLRARKLGYHYIIDRDGTVWKCAPVSRKVGHAGNSYGPREEMKRVSRKQNNRSEFVAGCSVNGYTIGISFVNENIGASHPVTSRQISAAEDLVLAIKSVIPTLEYVTTHAIVSPGRKSDPRTVDLNDFAGIVGLKPWRYAG